MYIITCFVIYPVKSEKIMKKYVVIGDPVAHSRSPGMQNAAFAVHGLGRPYDRMLVKAEAFDEFVRFARQELDGFNLTVPHKSLIIPYLKTIAPAAAAAGSVNTVTVKDGEFHGDSTDGYGLEMALKRNFGITPAGKRFVFAGCGGAAHATAFHLAEQGAKSIFLANRTVSKAVELAAKIKEFSPEVEVETAAIDDVSRLRGFFSNVDVLIQATSLGLRESDPPPFPLELLEVNRDLCIYDTIYHKTPIQKRAEELGLKCADGMWMLIYQGARSFEIWTGKEAPVEEMLKGFLEDTPCVLH